MSTYSTRQTLLQRIKDQHDEKSWEDFVHYYQAFIYNIIRKMGLNPSDCEDLCQNILLRLWKSLPNFDYDKQKAGFRYWLFRVVQNVVNSHLKKQISRKEKFAESYLPEEEIKEESARNNEIDSWIEKEWQVHVSNLAYENIMPQLSEKARQVFDLFLEEVPAAEIAQKVGIKENSVYIYKNRVRDKLLAEIRYLRSQLE